MLKKILQSLIAVVGVYLGYGICEMLLTNKILRIDKGFIFYFYFFIVMTIFGTIFYAVAPWIIDKVEKIIDKAEKQVLKQKKSDLLIGLMGIIVGIIVAFLVSLPLSLLNLPPFLEFIISVVSIFIYITLASLGYRLSRKNSTEIKAIFNKKKENKDSKEIKKTETEVSRGFVKPKLLDTSVIIDGRIKQIAKTGFIDGDLIITNFVLEELQYIADSSDEIKRQRGRRGLDIVKDLQNSSKVNVINSDKDYTDTKEVDIKLLKYAKDMGCSIVTNDFNLNKLASVQNIKVLNINDLSNAVKTVVIPGEKMIVNIVKEGREKKQGLAYLDDGTMIVVEEAKDLIGETLEVVVTTVLQTAAGKMIFAKISNK